MARKRVLLVDGNNILHQSFHKFEKLKSTDGKPSGAIFGFFKSLHMYIDRFQPNDVYITFDNGHSPLRDKLLPEYKEHRQNISYDRESLFAQKAVIMKILRMLRIKYLFDKNNSTGFEGDDLLAYLYFKKISKECLVTIVSSDKDFNQLLTTDRVKIFNPRKEEYVRQTNCESLFGYTPYETVDYLSLVGDSSDDIPGFPGIGPVKARKFLDKWQSIAKYLELNADDKMKAVYERNKQLIDLKWFVDNHSLDLDKVLKTYTRRKINYEKFREVCIEYSFNSFMTDIFIEPFKKLLK
jgi:DNA polymerase-1